MSEHKKTITAISWCPDNPDLFASASADNLLIVWNVAEQKPVARLDNTKGGMADQSCVLLSQSCTPTARPFVQVSLPQSVGAGIQLTLWRMSLNVAHCIFGSMGILTLE